MMEQGKQKVAFWLMPVADARAAFMLLINQLAERCDAPVFEPHVTLYGAELAEQRGIEILDAVAAKTAPLQLQIEGVEFSDRYTKTLYVQFRASAKASAISDAIADGSQSSHRYEFDPHLSLLYKTMPQSEKEELARGITIPFAQVRFDALKLISVPGAVKAPEDVRAWRTLAERPLAGRFE